MTMTRQYERECECEIHYGGHDWVGPWCERCRTPRFNKASSAAWRSYTGHADTCPNCDGPDMCAEGAELSHQWVRMHMAAERARRSIVAAGDLRDRVSGEGVAVDAASASAGGRFGRYFRHDEIVNPGRFSDWRDAAFGPAILLSSDEHVVASIRNHAQASQAESVLQRLGRGPIIAGGSFDLDSTEQDTGLTITRQVTITTPGYASCRDCNTATRRLTLRQWSDGTGENIRTCDGHAAAVTLHDTVKPIAGGSDDTETARGHTMAQTDRSPIRDQYAAVRALIVEHAHAFMGHVLMCRDCYVDDADEIAGCDVGAALWEEYRKLAPTAADYADQARHQRLGRGPIIAGGSGGGCDQCGGRLRTFVTAACGRRLCADFQNPYSCALLHECVQCRVAARDDESVLAARSSRAALTEAAEAVLDTLPPHSPRYEAQRQIIVALKQARTEQDTGLTITRQVTMTTPEYESCRDCGSPTRRLTLRQWSDGMEDKIRTCDGHAAAVTMHDTVKPIAGGSDDAEPHHAENVSEGQHCELCYEVGDRQPIAARAVYYTGDRPFWPAHSVRLCAGCATDENMIEDLQVAGMAFEIRPIIAGGSGEAADEQGGTRRDTVRREVQRGWAALSREGRAHCLLNALRAMGRKSLYPTVGFTYTEREIAMVEAARQADEADGQHCEGGSGEAETAIDMDVVRAQQKATGERAVAFRRTDSTSPDCAACGWPLGMTIPADWTCSTRHAKERVEGASHHAENVARHAFMDHALMCSDCYADEIEGCDVGAALWEEYRKLAPIIAGGNGEQCCTAARYGWHAQGCAVTRHDTARRIAVGSARELRQALEKHRSACRSPEGFNRCKQTLAMLRDIDAYEHEAQEHKDAQATASSVRPRGPVIAGGSFDLDTTQATAIKFYRALGFGLSGRPNPTVRGAWNSFHLAGRREYGYQPWQQGSAEAAHSATLIAAVDRRAADTADISELSGAGWWRVNPMAGNG